MMCCVQEKITKTKFLSWDFNNCTITKLFIKKNTFFDVLKQSTLYGTQINTNKDILKSVYLYLINLRIDTSKNIKEKSPITFNGDSCFDITDQYINDVIIIREIFNVCQRNYIKLHIEIQVKDDKYLIYRDD